MKEQTNKVNPKIGFDILTMQISVVPPHLYPSNQRHELSVYSEEYEKPNTLGDLSKKDEPAKSSINPNNHSYQRKLQLPDLQSKEENFAAASKLHEVVEGVK